MFFLVVALYFVLLCGRKLVSNLGPISESHYFLQAVTLTTSICGNFPNIPVVLGLIRTLVETKVMCRFIFGAKMFY